MNFTDTNSFIEMAKNIEYKVKNHKMSKYLLIIVHWIDRIPDNYEDLQRQGSPDTCLSYWDCPLEWSVDPFYSCTVYCQLPDNIEWQNGGQIEDELHRFLSQKFDLVYFDCSKMKSDNFCIAEYGKFAWLILHVCLRKFQTHLRASSNDCSISSIKSISIKIWPSITTSSHFFSSKYCRKSSTKII